MEKEITEDTSSLARLLDYFKYLYEQENHRSEKLNASTNTYLVAITFAFTFLVGLLGWMFPKESGPLIPLDSTIQALLAACAGVAILLILASLIFTMLVVKVRPFERLCDPVKFAGQTSDIRDEADLMRAMISHYVVATDRNFQLDNQKARLLSYALQTFIVGFVLLLSALAGLYFSGR